MSGEVSSKIADLANLIKPELPIAAGVCVLAGEVIALGQLPTLSEGVLGFLVGFLVSGAAMASNDYFDLEVDRINAPQRPLPSGRVTKREVLLLTGAFTILGLAAAALLGLVPLLAAGAIWMVGIYYNWRGKEFGLAGNLMVAFSVSMTFVFGGLAVGAGAEPIVWIFGAMAFLFDLGEEIANGVMDAKGDAVRNARSLTRMKGSGFALNVSGGCFAALIALTIVPFAMGWTSIIYLAMVVAVDATIVILYWRLRRSGGGEEGKKMTRMLYLVMLVFIIFFLVSRAI